MGFNVDTKTKLVTVDHNHNNYAITTTHNNPVKITCRSICITSIFARTKSRRDRDIPGDNSPMLYALKKIDGLKTNLTSIKLLHVSYTKILDSILEAQNGIGSWDVIIPIPSSSPISSMLAKNIAKKVAGSSLVASQLAKVTAGEVRDRVKDLDIHSTERTKLNASIKRFIKSHGVDHPFQMKSINVKHRNNICPFMLSGHPMQAAPRRILLVDDMVTSGASIASAAELIQTRYPNISIDALTLIGSSK